VIVGRRAAARSFGYRQIADDAIRFHLVDDQLIGRRPALGAKLYGRVDEILLALHLPIADVKGDIERLLLDIGFGHPNANVGDLLPSALLREIELEIFALAAPTQLLKLLTIAGDERAILAQFELNASDLLLGPLDLLTRGREIALNGRDLAGDRTDSTRVLLLQGRKLCGLRFSRELGLKGRNPLLLLPLDLRGQRSRPLQLLLRDADVFGRHLKLRFQIRIARVGIVQALAGHLQVLCDLVQLSPQLPRRRPEVVDQIQHGSDNDEDQKSPRKEPSQAMPPCGGCPTFRRCVRERFPKKQLIERLSRHTPSLSSE